VRLQQTKAGSRATGGPHAQEEKRRKCLGREMLLTFHKQMTPVRRRRPAGEPVSLDQLLDFFLPTLPADGFRTEILINKLTIAAWERGSLENISVNAQEMASKLNWRRWYYDPQQHRWSAHRKPATPELTLMGN